MPISRTNDLDTVYWPADPADAHGADAGAEEDVLNTVLADLPNTVDERDAACETILAAGEYLSEHGPATMREIVGEVMPEHPLGYDVDGTLEKVEAGDRY